jgi:hypothetical protein
MFVGVDEWSQERKNDAEQREGTWPTLKRERNRSQKRKKSGDQESVTESTRDGR